MSQERMVNLAFVAAALMLWFLSAAAFAGLFDVVRPEWDVGLIGREFRLSNLLGIAAGVPSGDRSVRLRGHILDYTRRRVGRTRSTRYRKGSDCKYLALNPAQTGQNPTRA